MHYADEGTGHFVWIDAPDECLAEVRGFPDATHV
jgi:pimeloyl-ACP methyl ester carboxylesterase